MRLVSSLLSSLTNRIFFASALLATATIGVAFYFVSTRLRAEAEAELQRDLTETADLVEQQRAVLLDTFGRTARLIADLPKLKAAVATRDVPTIAPIARDYQEQAGADLFRVSSADGKLLVESGLPTDGVLQVVSAPVIIGLDRPDMLGTLEIGYRLDDQRAAGFKTVTGAEIAFAVDGRVRSSTLADAEDTQLNSLLDAQVVPRATIGGREYAVLVRTLPSTPNSAVGARQSLPAAAIVHASTSDRGSTGTDPVVIVLRSRSERMSTLSAIETALVAVAAVSVLVAVVVSYGVSRTITRPLARITDHMRQIAATGDLTRTLEPAGAGGWHDDDAQVLASSFNALTDSVATFQRQAAQRERLSSLGRMSTIIAHEIRNPLMIIKGALRQLTRDGATAADVREAAADIDGETVRLNRVVNEVLDFARPVRIDRASTDVNAVCRDASGAVAAAERHPSVVTHLDPTVPALETDAEKLRTVLVNVLTNARHAVLARTDVPSTASGPLVTLTTSRLSDARVAIAIDDRGVGISAEDLPKIFDPFFTTRRTGTGLGLAIAKNLIDRLGGSMSVVSHVGSGTRIRIELGHAPSPRT